MGRGGQPHFETFGAGLFGVATVPGTYDLWAVGIHDNETLIEQAWGL